MKYNTIVNVIGDVWSLVIREWIIHNSFKTWMPRRKWPIQFL